MRQGNQFLRTFRRQSGAAMVFPQAKPGLKMFLPQTERNMFHRHRAGIRSRAARHGGPEIGDLFQVFGPIFDDGIKYFGQ